MSAIKLSFILAIITGFHSTFINDGQNETAVRKNCIFEDALHVINEENRQFRMRRETGIKCHGRWKSTKLMMAADRATFPKFDDNANSCRSLVCQINHLLIFSSRPLFFLLFVLPISIWKWNRHSHRASDRHNACVTINYVLQIGCCLLKGTQRAECAATENGTPHIASGSEDRPSYEGIRRIAKRAPKCERARERWGDTMKETLTENWNA